MASAPARVVNVASTAHQGARHGLDFDDLQSTRHYRGMRAYSRSKLANILFTRELARAAGLDRRHRQRLHPGTVATGFARDDDAKGFLAFGVRLIKPFILTPEKGARTSVYLASSPEVADVTGEYFVKCRPKVPSAAARNDAAAVLLWSVSEELVAQAATGAAGGSTALAVRGPSRARRSANSIGAGPMVFAANVSAPFGAARAPGGCHGGPRGSGGHGGGAGHPARHREVVGVGPVLRDRDPDPRGAGGARSPRTPSTPSPSCSASGSSWPGCSAS